MKFEYTRALVPVANVLDIMNQHGQDGWRVINVRHLDPEYNTPVHELRRRACRKNDVLDLVAILFERQVTVPA